MKSTTVRWQIAIGAMTIFPAAAYTQEAAVTGTVEVFDLFIRANYGSLKGGRR